MENKKDKTEESKIKESSRRKFLKSGFAIGAGTVLAGGIISSVSKVQAETSGNKIKVLTTNGKVIEINKSILEEYKLKPCDHTAKNHAREGIPYRKFTMVVDIGKCNNARKCIEKCQEAHHLAPDQEWMKVYKMQESKEMAPYWFPKSCYHCDNAPCTDVCPVSATFKRSDGIVLVDSDQCIGCKYCMVACPYEARVFNWRKPDISDDVANQEYCPETSVPPKSGTVGKCDFCPDMIREKKLPHCVTACPNGAIYFGDIKEDVISNGDETVRFSEIMEAKSGYRYMEYFGTEPSTYYLPPVDRIFPFKDEKKTDS
ncbi:MAG: 4Fe-4S dicluster domain-containing protein [Bacteroidetes bacterium]|nr:MAG: 4Fe-4S dicluster domain-containing protein [Bacteroidota bacterium]